MCGVLSVLRQLVLAGDMVDSVDQQGQHSTSVLVHRVRDWTEREFRHTHHHGGSSNGRGVDSGSSTTGTSSSSSSNGSSSSVGGGSSMFRVQPTHPPLAGGPQERFVDQRRYANISRCDPCACSVGEDGVSALERVPCGPCLPLSSTFGAPYPTRLCCMERSGPPEVPSVRCRRGGS